MSSSGQTRPVWRTRRGNGKVRPRLSQLGSQRSTNVTAHGTPTDIGMKPAAASRFYTELESLRGVAALMVVFFHIFGARPGPETLSRLDLDAVTNLILTSVFSGPGAVTVFFVLSGFVLGQSLEREPALTSRSYLEFIVRRAFRLLPTVWTAIVLAIVVSLVMKVPVRWDLLGPVFVLQEQALLDFNAPVTSFLFPLWSLHVEVWASAAFPILAFANRLLSAPFQILILALLLWVSNSGEFPFWTACFFCFQFGLMIRSVFVPAVERMPKRLAFALFVLAVIAVTVPTDLYLLGFIGTVDHTNIEGFGAAFIVAYLLVPQGGWLARALNFRPLRFLGRISYSLYVFHFPLLSLVETWTWNHIIAQPYLPAQVVCIFTVVPVCLGAGTLGYYCIEAPSLRLGRRIAKITRPQHALGTATGGFHAPIINPCSEN